MLLLGIQSCIEFYRPDTGISVEKYVVDGQITDQEGYQYVTVSTTSSFDNPKFVPLSFCQVKIRDNNGNEFNLSEYERGKYRAWITKEYLVPGNSYQVDITTTMGIEFVSDFDQMPVSAELDSLYFDKKDVIVANPLQPVQAIQFYVDFDRSNTTCYFFRWEIVETWEHHAVYPITWYNGGNSYYFPPNYSRYTCWTTEVQKNIYVLSLKNNLLDVYRRKPLHLVDNQSQKLTFGYSVLVNQYSLSEEAYMYWEKLSKNSEQGGLYYSQPIRAKGNITCVSDPEIDVLGFFSASSLSSKRIFVQNIPDFDVYEPQCTSPRLPNPKVSEPFKYMIEIDGVKYIIDDACVECDYMSGTTVKPTFWPN